MNSFKSRKNFKARSQGAVAPLPYPLPRLKSASTRQMVKPVFAISAAIVAAIVIFSMSFADEVEEVRIYCSNVENGMHPDYKEIYQNECKGFSGNRTSSRVR